MNNAYSAGEMLFKETIERPFWEAPDDPAVAWDACNNVGLRNHYLCTVYASRFVFFLCSEVLNDINLKTWQLYLVTGRSLLAWDK